MTKEQRCERNRRYYATHRENFKQYRADRREHYNALNRDWIVANRDRYNASKYKYRDALKIEVLAHYSNGSMKCSGCGFDNVDALCLDHIADNGAADRKLLNISSRGSGGGYRTYERLKTLGYPPGYQVLCANCNLIKEIKRKRHARGKGVLDARPRSSNHHSAQLHS